MSQYLLAIYRDYALAVPPEVTRQKWDGVVALKEKMTGDGALVFQSGLIPAESATVVRQSGGDFLITDGPYTETKEHLAGFFIVSADGLDVALEWAKLAAVAQQRPIEVRKFFDGNLDDAIRGMAAGETRGTNRRDA